MSHLRLPIHKECVYCSVRTQASYTGAVEAMAINGLERGIMRDAAVVLRTADRDTAGSWAARVV